MNDKSLSVSRQRRKRIPLAVVDRCRVNSEAPPDAPDHRETAVVSGLSELEMVVLRRTSSGDTDCAHLSLLKRLVSEMLAMRIAIIGFVCT